MYKRTAVQRMDSVIHYFDRLMRKSASRCTTLDWRVTKIKEYVAAHPEKAESNLRTLCKELRLPVSPRQARRLFRNAAGISISEYAEIMRLSIAAEQLRTTDAPIKAIATEAGYYSAANLARCFRKLFMLSPVEFRTLHRHARVRA